MQKPNDKDGSEVNKMLWSAKLWKNSVCVTFVLIPTLGKSAWTLFSFYGFIYKQGTIWHMIFKQKLKDDAVPTILGPTVMSQHKCE